MKWNDDLKTKWPYLPVIPGILATFLFLLQGGYGGGHGKFDGVILPLMLPAIAIVVVLPLSESILRFDYIVIIAIPTLINFVALVLIDRLVVRKRRPQRSR